MFGCKGGIQMASLNLLNAMVVLAPQVKIQVHLLHDRCFSSDYQASQQTKFYFSGYWPNKIRNVFYTLQALFSAVSDRPDLIITTHLCFTPIAYLLKRLIKIPYWTIAHGIEAWDIQKQHLQQTFQAADRILSVSQYTSGRILSSPSFDIDSQKIKLLPNTFELHRFDLRPKPKHLIQYYQLDEDQPIILTVSRLLESEKYKGYDRILEALPQIRECIPNIHYILVGKGDDLSRIETLIQELNLDRHVTLTGFIPDEDLCDHYNLCDVFAMPSKGEGFGIVYLEAMACGKPCLGGNQDGALDALAQGELGVLVNPDDIDEIAQTLIQLLKKSYPNPLLYQPEKLRKSVIDRFGFEIFQNYLYEHLQQF